MIFLIILIIFLLLIYLYNVFWSNLALLWSVINNISRLKFNMLPLSIYSTDTNQFNWIVSVEKVRYIIRLHFISKRGPQFLSLSMMCTSLFFLILASKVDFILFHSFFPLQCLIPCPPHALSTLFAIQHHMMASRNIYFHKYK